MNLILNIYSYISSDTIKGQLGCCEYNIWYSLCKVEIGRLEDTKSYIQL